MKAKLIIDFPVKGCRDCILKYKQDHDHICTVTENCVNNEINDSKMAPDCPLKIIADPEKDIIVLNLSGGTYNLLKRNGINKISQLQAMTKAELLKFRGMGKGRYSEIERAMEGWKSGAGEDL